MKKVLGIVISLVVVIVVVFVAYRYFFVFGYGVKAGQLNFFVKKGYIFKTYEGRVIQPGLKSVQPGSMQSNEFDFSVVDEKVANTLMTHSGAILELHYKEYKGTLPWRGMSEYIVDSIQSIKDENGQPIKI